MALQIVLIPLLVEESQFRELSLEVCKKEHIITAQVNLVEFLLMDRIILNKYRSQGSIDHL